MFVSLPFIWRPDCSNRVYARLKTDSSAVDDMTRRLDELEASLTSSGGDSASATPTK